MTTFMAPIYTYVRWRPLANSELDAGEMDRSTNQENNSLYSVSITQPAQRPWKSAGAFKDTYEPADDNARVFQAVVSETIPKVLRGASCNFFAYGHTGSGKTHTVIGYDDDQEDRMGLCLAAARDLFDALKVCNQDLDAAHQLGVGLSVFELRKNVAVDLLNGRTECHIRQGADGKTHIRGATETLEGGRVRVRPVTKRPCWTFASLRQQLRDCLDLRAVGSSTVHEQSSRTHAVLELEIINVPLVEARDAVIERQSELVPVGKRATDITVAEQTKGVIKGPDGTWAPNPDYTPNQALIDAVQSEQAACEARVRAAEEHVAAMLQQPGAHHGLGGKLVFVDLAGSEYHQETRAMASRPLSRQTAQEKQEGRQINTDLLGLKEVIRACSSNHRRIPFRASPLTMVLREHFLGSKNGTSAMIVTVSPAQSQYAATLNSLKYGSLVGAGAA